MRASLLTFLDDCARNGDDVALVYHRGLRTHKWTYLHLRSASFQMARELEKRGVAKGDRVLFWGQNSGEWVAAFFGCLLRGAIVVPLDIDCAPDFVVRVQDQVEARLLFTESTRNADRLMLSIPSLSLSQLGLDQARHEGYIVETVDVRPDDHAKPPAIETIFDDATWR